MKSSWPNLSETQDKWLLVSVPNRGWCHCYTRFKVYLLLLLFIFYMPWSPWHGQQQCMIVYILRVIKIWILVTPVKTSLANLIITMYRLRESLQHCLDLLFEFKRCFYPFIMNFILHSCHYFCRTYSLKGYEVLKTIQTISAMCMVN